MNQTKAASASDLTGSDPSFAQRSFREEFSAIGRQELSRIAGRDIRTIDDLAGALKSGEVRSSSITLETVKREGVVYILNTRTAQALERAGIKKKDWKLVDKTGNSDAERRLDGQLSRNELRSGDAVSKPTSQGSGSGSNSKTGGGLGSLIRDIVRSIFGG